MSRARLLILSFSDISSDARVLKQVRRFADDYDVTTCGYGTAPDPRVSHIEIPAELVYWRYPRALLLTRRFAAAYRANPVISHLQATLPTGTFDIILADDIDTVPLALSLTPRRGVHADLHEFAPRMKEDVTRWRLFIAPFMRWLCRTYLPQVASITTVGEGIAREYEKDFGVRAQVVTNASPYAACSPSPTGTPLRLVHAGAARSDRFLELMIEAVGLVKQDVTLDFYLTGQDQTYLASLRERAAETGRVSIHPAVAYDELIVTLNDYDVGIYVLPPTNFNNAWALPNKFFDFIQARLALAFGPSPEMAAVIRHYGLGVISTDFTAASLAAAIDSIDAEAVNGYKAASDRAARELSAEAQIEIWAAAIASLGEGRAPTTE